MVLDGFPGFKKEDIEKYSKFRWWLGAIDSDLLYKTMDLYPHKEALVSGNNRLTYSQLIIRLNIECHTIL